MGKLIQFPISRVRRSQRARVDVFERHFELLDTGFSWDRFLVLGFACLALMVSV